jgi:hypothetical protein
MLAPLHVAASRSGQGKPKGRAAAVMRRRKQWQAKQAKGNAVKRRCLALSEPTAVMRQNMPHSLQSSKRREQLRRPPMFCGADE